MPRLAAFIRENTEQILAEWETFARNLPAGDTMDIAALRDHAQEMLGVIAADLDRPQSLTAQAGKSRGESDAGGADAPNAAQEHGAGRARSGYSVGEMISEFRALRASVMRLWAKAAGKAAASDLDDMTRFNEAIDQAIAESVDQFNAGMDQTKDRFLAILGHDLRTPLGAIIMSSQFMLDTIELGEPSSTLIGRMASSARRMNQMVLDLIEFTRTRFGDAVPVRRAEMDVGAMLDEVVAEIKASYPSSVVLVERSGNLNGSWDASRLSQALTNLVGNAVQHGKGAPITIAAHGSDSEIAISVQNEGPLIPEDQLGRIFQVMTQGADDGARDHQHMGLGLYIVDKIVNAHGGSIDVASAAGQATTFTVHLPRAGP